MPCGYNILNLKINTVRKGHPNITTERIIKDSFSVIGKEGSTADGAQFVQRLWEQANSHFGEVAPLAKKNADDSLAGCWGLMSDFSMSFMPWQNGFSEGRYLAGIECEDDAQAPDGWTKWTIPGFEYVRIACEGGDIFREGLAYLETEGLTLAGAVQDFTDPSTGMSYMCYPIRKL